MAAQASAPIVTASLRGRPQVFPARSAAHQQLPAPDAPRFPPATRGPGRPAWPGIPGTAPSACSTSCGDSAKNSSGRPTRARQNQAQPRGVLPSDGGIAPLHQCHPLVPRSPAAPSPWSTVTGGPSSGDRRGRARPLPARRNRRTARAGAQLAPASRPNSAADPADLGIGRLDLGRGLAAFGLIDPADGINHHRLPGDDVRRR